MSNVDNAIYHVLKIVHKNVVLPIYTSHTEGYHMQLFLVRCHIQRLNGSMLHDRLKQNQTHKQETCEFNLKVYMVLFTC